MTIRFRITESDEDILHSILAMRSNLVLYGHDKENSAMSKIYEIDDDFWLRNQVDCWSGKHIARWIEGLGDSMNPYIGMVRDHIRSGRHLELVDNDMLLKIGISGLGPRKLILQAIQLLLYFCHEAPHENLQSLAMKVTLGCKEVIQAMKQAILQREKASRRSEIVSILNSIYSAISYLDEHVKSLIFWLDRSPFDNIVRYIEYRNKISFLIYSIVRNANVQPKTLFNVSSDIVKQSEELMDLSDAIIKQSNDPAVLYTANVEEALLKRHSADINWGLNLQSSYRGVHVISEIKESSPADACARIDAGDEIMCINGKTVIGWDLTRVAEKLGSTSDLELRLVVNKRPRDTVTNLLRNAPKITAKPLVKLAPGSQATYTADNERSFLQEHNYPLNRRRSSTFMTTIQNRLDNKPNPNSIADTRKRSASISYGEKDWPTEDSPMHVQWDLIELVGRSDQPETRVVRRARTMRHQPDGYVRSFIDNKLMHEIEDDVVTEHLPINIKCPTEFSTITVIEPTELTLLNIVEPSITDEDWSAPPSDSALQRLRTVNVDSPRKMLTSLEEAFPAFAFPTSVLPSPSTSSIHSIYSPAPFKMMSSNMFLEFPSSQEEIPQTPTTPSLFISGEKIFEGWVRRRKTGTELSESTNKWPKCWLCLKGAHLSIYPNQHAKRADITINVTKCVASDSIDIKTSKKFVFRLSKPNMDYYFSCYNQLDMKNWINKIQYSGNMFSNPPRVMSKSMTYYKEDEENPPASHYNTLTGLPSLMSQSHYEESTAASPSTTNSLPRSGLLSSLSKSKPLSPTSLKQKKT